ncbi:MAG: type VI secretion system tube protein Hcp [SAR202 cluster bacterium]|nr:type VI secretion system tube protein Hcp [SAR202 cluster bacterium]
MAVAAFGGGYFSSGVPEVSAAQFETLARGVVTEHAQATGDVDGSDGSTRAAVDYFLKIDGIPGESSDEKHRGEIELESWSWGETNMGTHAGGGGGGAGKVSMQDFHFTMKSSKASPMLMLACATGQHIKQATLFVRKSGGDQQKYMKITLSDVLVSSFQIGGQGGDIPTDQISLNFTKIEFEYKPQKPDGSLDAPVKAGYDLKMNKKL